VGTAAHQLLLVAALAALGAAALLAASTLAPRGLERALAAAALGAAAAVVEALALGLAGAGGSALAVGAAAGATWIACRLLVPAPELGAGRELASWWRRAPRLARAALGVLGGGLAGLALAQLATPYLGLDGGTYHLSEVVRWVQDGTPGSVEPIFSGLPVGSYPVSAEVALTWAAALSHGLAPVALWTPALIALMLAAGWLGLRELGVAAWAVALSLAALLLVPVTLRGAIQAETDFPALAWLAVAAALTACSPRRPRLLVPALVAGGLALGTKTTTGPALILLALLAVPVLRREGRALARPLAGAAALAVAAGGVWYLRNIVDHGSPLWPFVSGPFGDPVPSLFSQLDQSFLTHPTGRYASQVWPTYRAVLAGGLVLLAGALSSPIWARGRAVLAAAGLTLAALLAWASAPFTGAGAAPFVQIQAVRYMVPALAAATVTIALASRHGRWAGRIAGTLLAAAIGWSLYRYWQLAYLPHEWLLLVGGAAGAAAAAALRRASPRPVAVAGAAALALALALAAPGYAPRHEGAGETDSALIGWLADQPAWRDGSAPVAAHPVPVALTAGSRLQHPLPLVGRDEACARVRARVREGWFVLTRYDERFFPISHLRGCVRGIRPSFDDGYFLVYGRGGSSSTAGRSSQGAARSRSRGRTLTALGER
jgi:hypothetical protein